jgi:hypothetical protein
MDEQNTSGYEPPVTPEQPEQDGIQETTASPVSDQQSSTPETSSAPNVQENAAGDPSASQSAAQDAYQQPINQVPVNQTYGENQYDYRAQQNDLDPDVEKRANTVKILGIVSIVTGILCSCCCTLVGPIVGIVGLVKASGLKTVMPMMTEESRKNVDIGRICCIIGIVLGALGMILSLILSASGYMSELLTEIS